jgi:hypothetical protein
MYYAVETSAEQKGRISHDLTAVIEHWNAVGIRTLIGSFFIPSLGLQNVARFSSNFIVFHRLLDGSS